MIIALLAVLGVNLIVIVVLLGVMLSCRRWVSHQPDAFKRAIRVVLRRYASPPAAGRFVLVWVLTPISVTSA